MKLWFATLDGVKKALEKDIISSEIAEKLTEIISRWGSTRMGAAFYDTTTGEIGVFPDHGGG